MSQVEDLTDNLQNLKFQDVHDTFLQILLAMGCEMLSRGEGDSAFAWWLRTGRLRPARSDDGLELKFNPWHDPQNGRFTFANTGVFYGRGVRGGSGATGFGGGGASGRWKVQPHPAERSRTSRPQATVGRPPTRNSPKPGEKPFREVSRNGYLYRIDDRGRTRGVSGSLTVAAKAVRSRRAQALAGGPDRRPGDDGGHYVAARFEGPTDAFNHFAQDANFNRGGYRVLEDQWAQAKRKGKAVYVRISPLYFSRSSRPDVIDVYFSIDGDSHSLKFDNDKQEVKRGKRK